MVVALPVNRTCGSGLIKYDQMRSRVDGIKMPLRVTIRSTGGVVKKKESTNEMSTFFSHIKSRIMKSPPQKVLLAKPGCEHLIDCSSGPSGEKKINQMLEYGLYKEVSLKS